MFKVKIIIGILKENLKIMLSDLYNHKRAFKSSKKVKKDYSTEDIKFDL